MLINKLWIACTALMVGILWVFCGYSVGILWVMTFVNTWESVESRVNKLLGNKQIYPLSNSMLDGV